MRALRFKAALRTIRPHVARFLRRPHGAHAIRAIRDTGMTLDFDQTQLVSVWDRRDELTNKINDTKEELCRLESQWEDINHEVSQCYRPVVDALVDV